MQFLNDLGIDLTFCSAYHHLSNPAEHAIRNVKSLMKHCGSANKPWCISLLEYLATPLSTGLPSPAAMMGREFRGLLPHVKGHHYVCFIKSLFLSTFNIHVIIASLGTSNRH